MALDYAPPTVARLAAAKRLPPEFLIDLAMTDIADGVSIPYYDEAGIPIATKRRTALKAGDGSFWMAGARVRAYGLWRLDEARKQVRLVLVEGESDCWALWLHRIAALGLPGCDTVSCLEREHLIGIERVYVHHEPDAGGERFVANVGRRLRELEFTGKALELRMPDGLKDPADLHAADPERFDERFRQALAEATPLAQRSALPRPVTRLAVADDPDPEPVVRAAHEVLSERTLWLWKHRLPRGAVTLLDGDPNLGKSTLTCDLAARLTTGRPLPGDTDAQTGGVLVLSAEDSPEQTLRPRLEAAGADLNRVHFLDAVRDVTGERPVALPADLDLLEALIVARGIALVVIDPLVAYLEGKVNAHRDQDVRRALYPLRLLAERTGAAVLALRHLNKAPGGPSLYRGGGSIGIIGAARCAWLLARDPAGGEGRVLAVNKSNLGPFPPALTFTLVNDPARSVARLEWGGESSCTAEELLAAPRQEARPTETGRCVGALMALLGPEPLPAATALAILGAQGFTDSTIKEAKRRLRLRTERQGGREGAWYWLRPEDAPADILGPAVPPGV